jgi:hypothetical protein
MTAEWADSRAGLEDLLGHSVTVASLPGGYLSRRVTATAADAGLRVLFTSEPNPVPRHAGECTLVGRFAIRRGYSAEFIRDLAKLSWPAVWRERGVWQAKKIIKPLLGSVYPQIGELIASGK